MFIVLFFLLRCSLVFSAVRSDYDSTGVQSAVNNLLGTTCIGSWDITYNVYCPENTWVYGFALTTATNYGILNIILDCRNLTYDTASQQLTAASSVLVKYNNMTGPSIDALTKTTTAVSTLVGFTVFLRGILLRMWCPTATSTPKGVNEVKLVDHYFNTLSTTYTATDGTASWVGLSYCKEGFAFCGYSMYYNHNAHSSNTAYNYGLVDLGLKCCRVCHYDQGIYFDATTKNCAFCDPNCRKCYGTSTNCTACTSSYTLSGNTCTTTIAAQTVSNEFFSTYTLDATWSHNFGTGVNLTKTCGIYTMIGGYPLFVANKYLVKTVTGLPTHTMLRIKYQLFKIGNFSSVGNVRGDALISVDNVLLNVLWYTNVPNPQYYDSDCGTGNLITFSWYCEHYITHSASSVSVKFAFNSTSGYMGISRMTIESQSCDVTCQTCTGTAANQCTSCPSGTYLTSINTCSATCSSPYFADPSTSTCVTVCSNMPPYYGDSTTRTCVTVCPDYYYKNNADRLCHKPCSNYGDPVSGFCVDTCPDGWYGDATQNICLPCDFNCQTCVTSATNCLTCKYAWLGASPTCTNPTFISSLANNKFTQISLSNSDVTSSGFTISNPLTTINKMSTCGTYKLVGGDTIFGPSTTFSKSFSGLAGHINARVTFYVMKIGNWDSNNILIKVDGSTIASQMFTVDNDSPAYKPCSSLTYTEALRGVDVFFSHSISTLALTITSDLPSTNTQATWGIYQLSVTLFLCDSTCQTCAIWNDASQCLTCASGLYLQAVVGPAYCKSTCLDTTTYKYNTDYTCRPCDSSCLTCSAGTANDCLTCNPTYLLLPPGPSACSSTCNSGYYKADPAKQCLPCDSTCKECSNSGTGNCISCKTNTYLQASVGPSQCLSTCPSHTYKDTTNLVCRNCDPTCDECSDSGASFCIKCTGTGIVLLLPPGPSTCGTTCNVYYYPNTVAHECQSCSTNCKTCLDALSTSCTQCKPSFYLQNPAASTSSCLTTCPSNTFKDNSNYQCTSCDTTCQECSATGANFCLSCKTGTYLQALVGPSTCLSTCPIGKYPDVGTLICQNCDTSCLSCNIGGINSCLTCKSGDFLQTTPAPAACLSTCPSNRYSDLSDKTCKLCDTSCLTCFNAGPSQCKTCNIGFYLQLPIGPASCNSFCPSNSYKNDATMSCLTCDTTCLTCIGPSSSDCQSCSEGKVLANSPPSKCSSVCGVNYFFNLITKVCEICDVSCKTCSQAGQTGCQSCNSSAFLQSLVGPARCDITCPNGSFPNYTDNICHQCDPTCVLCANGYSNGCTKCGGSLFLFSPPGPSYCKTSCPSGYYADNLTNSCLKCEISCKECQNGTLNDCTKCNSTDYYLQDLNGKKTNSSGKCTEIPILTPILKGTSYSLIYLLIFSSNFSSIYNKYSNNTNITIDGVANTSYIYNITQVEGTDIYMISFFNATCSITNSPLMFLKLRLPSNMTEIYNIRLSTSTLQTHFNYYYYIEPSTWKTINQTSEAGKTMDDVVAKTFVANNILSAGSGVMFFCLVSMDMIRFLRYFEVRYPENVLSMFRSSLPTADIIPNFYADVDPKDGNLPNIFVDYGVSMYSFNNNGNTLVEGLVYWSVGWIALIFVNFFKKQRNRYLKIILILLSMVFVWSYSLSYFLSNYITFAFYSLLGYRFPPMETPAGKLNVLFSVATGLFVVIFFPFIVYKIKKVRSNVVVPFEPVDIQDSENLKSPGSASFQKCMSSNDKSPTKEFQSPKHDILNDESPRKNNNIVMENLDTPNISTIRSPNLRNSSGTDSEMVVLNPMKPNFRDKVTKNFRKVSNFMNKMRMSISKMSKVEDYPFDWRKSMKTLDDKLTLSRFDNSGSIENKSITKNKSSLTEDNKSSTIKEAQSLKLSPPLPVNKIPESRYKSLHKDFKHETVLQSYFIIWSLFKQLLYCIFITLMFDKPYEGLICSMILEGVYILSIFFINPFKECSEYFQNLFNEGCGFTAIFTAFYISKMDRDGILDEEFKMKLGWIIVGSNLMLIGMFLLRMLIGWSIFFYQMGKELWKRMGSCKKKNIVRDENGEQIDEEKMDKGVFDKILELEGFLR